MLFIFYLIKTPCLSYPPPLPGLIRGTERFRQNVCFYYSDHKIHSIMLLLIYVMPFVYAMLPRLDPHHLNRFIKILLSKAPSEENTLRGSYMCDLKLS